MESPTYVALSRQAALQRQMEVIANNIANANTTGYKQQRMLFTEFLERPGIHEQVSFVQDRAVVRNLTAGSLTQTNNPLDMALTGPGYFTVDTASGRRYTRAGHFKLNDKRQIVDGGGLPVLDERGQPLTIPENTREIRVASNGTISTEQGDVGKLNIVTFRNEQLMTEVGSGLYVTDEQPQPAPAETKVTQDVLEQSNVNSITEMTSMIEVARQYQQNQKILENEHERVRTAIRRLVKPIA